jgi:hypothetical protein
MISHTNNNSIEDLDSDSDSRTDTDDEDNREPVEENNEDSILLTRPGRLTGRYITTNVGFNE